MDRETVDLVKKSLVGQTCKQVTFPGVLFIEFESNGLSILCSWRVRYEDRLMGGGAGDIDESSKSQIIEIVMGKRVSDVEVQEDTNDLRIEFDSGIMFETFAESNFYENWQLAVGAPPQFIIG